MGAVTAATAGSARGRDAQRPSDIPKPGWSDIVLRVKNEIAKDRLSIISAGVPEKAPGWSQSTLRLLARRPRG